MNCQCNFQRRILSIVTRSILIPVIVFGFLVSSLFGQQIKINSGAYLNNQGTAYIRINNAGLINNGSYTKGTETVTFSGSTSKTFSGSSNTDMYNLSAANTGGITTEIGQLTTNNLTIEIDSKFTITAVKAVTVNNTLTNNAGNAGFVLQSDAAGTASLIHNTNDVPVTVKRYLSGNAEAWHFMSSPVSAQSISGTWLPIGTYGNGTGYDLYLWNEPNNCWIYKLDVTSTINWNTVHPETNFAVGRGYLYSVQALNPTKEFVGNLNNGSINYGLTSSSTDATLKGFNLVGNPYPSSIDWAATTGWIRTILTESGGGYNMWIWNPTANNYGVCNSATGSGTNNVTRYIAPMQGYFVQTTSVGNMSSTNEVRVQNAANDWFKVTIVEDKLLSMIVTSGAGNGYDEVQMIFGYPENENGAVKLFSRVLTAPSLYMTSEENFLSLRYFTNTEENPVVPIMFNPGMDGNYTINFNFDRSKFEIILLEDRQMNYFQNMKEEQTYSFTSTKTDDVNRFALHFSNIENQPDKELPAKIYTDGSNLVIDLVLVSENTDVYIYNLLGRLLYQKTLSGKNRYNINLTTGEQIIFIYLANPNGNLYRKLIWDRK